MSDSTLFALLVSAVCTGACSTRSDTGTTGYSGDAMELSCDQLSNQWSASIKARMSCGVDADCVPSGWLSTCGCEQTIARSIDEAAVNRKSAPDLLPLLQRFQQCREARQLTQSATCGGPVSAVKCISGRCTAEPASCVKH